MLAKIKYPSKTEIGQLFAFCLTIINTLAIYSIITEMPALVLRLVVWDNIGAVAYSLCFALVETLGVFVLIAVGAILVVSFLKGAYFAITALLLWPTFTWHPMHICRWMREFLLFLSRALGWFILCREL